MMTVTDGGADAGMAPVSGEELALMREAAARLGLPAPDADMFSGLAVPFTPDGGERSHYQRTGGHHWCTAADR